LCRKLHFDGEFSAMPSGSLAICGVSAAIAKAGKVKSDPKQLSYLHRAGARRAPDGDHAHDHQGRGRAGPGGRHRHRPNDTAYTILQLNVSTG